LISLKEKVAQAELTAHSKSFSSAASNGGNGNRLRTSFQGEQRTSERRKEIG